MTDDQFARIVELLSDIRDGIVALCVSGTLDEETGVECEHPEDSRVTLATPGDVNHWVCAVCRFDNKAPPVPMN